MKLITTLNGIRKHIPCVDGWGTLLTSLGKTKADDEPLDLMHVLKSNDIKDAAWCLRCFDYHEYCLFLADIAESALPIFEAKYPDNDAPRLAIQAIRDFHADKITEDELIAAANAADAAATNAANAADAAAAYAATNAADAADAAAAAAHAAYAAAHAATNAAAHAAYAAAHAAAYAAAYAADAGKWQEIEKLFIKHFGE